MKKLLFLTLGMISGLALAGSIKKPWKVRPVHHDPAQPKTELFPVVFHTGYDIGFMGLERLHPFDAKKYGRVYTYLQKRLPDKITVYTPQEVTDSELQRVHTQDYLEKLKRDTSIMLSSITEIELLRFLPNFFARRWVLKPMRLATGGSILASRLALEYGRAVNLSGGYHHAKADSGGGFCALSDIPLTAYTLLDEGVVKKVMVIDLDAHQGNGHEAIFASDPRVAIFDVYNALNYPGDVEARKHITFDFPVEAEITDNAYLSLIRTELPSALEQTQPDLIIYNAGTDIYENDPLGCMGISKEGIIERDHIVFEEAIRRNIPIVMVLSGGYTKESADIIGASLENVITHYIR